MIRLRGGTIAKVMLAWRSDSRSKVKTLIPDNLDLHTQGQNPAKAAFKFPLFLLYCQGQIKVKVI